MNLEIDFKIKNPVFTNEVFTIVKSNEKINEPIRYTWIHLVNYSKFNGQIYNYDSESPYEFQSPPFPGIYLLQLYFAGIQKTYKIIVL